MSRLLITGGAGFLGSYVVRSWIGRGGEILNVDLLTYAGSPARVSEVVDSDKYTFVRADIADHRRVSSILAEFAPDAVVHFAAESHVTRSERDPDRFWRTNVEGTRVMLQAADSSSAERFIHISTDEVYGPILEGSFREEDKQPGDGQATSPYAKSKAVADDIARESHGDMEVVLLRPTNCFGAWQFPEKAFARWVTRALSGSSVPIWGDGKYVRQWLHAADLAEAVLLVLEASSPGRVYNVGPRHDPEITNVDLARWLLEFLDLPTDRLEFTQYDRPDHDRRYAVDPSRIESLGWKSDDPWDRLAETVEWFRANEDWWKPLVAEAESIYADRATR